MVSALSISGFSTNAETNESTQSTSDLSENEIQYGGLLGSMLSDEINESVESKQEAANSDYAVYKLYHDPKAAYIGADYHAKNDCTLFIGFYNDEGTELITSVTKELKADDKGYTEMYVLDALPEHYLIKAFIIGSELLNPLSKPCIYNKCTKQMQEILSKSISDFTADTDEDGIVNLDEKEDNNFIILQDDVIRIDPAENTDIYKGKDENGNYIFENAVEVAKLKKGDKTFINSSPEMVTFVVDSITVDGNSVIISGADTEISEFFKFIKFNSSECTNETYLEEQENEDYNVEFKQLPQPFSPNVESDDPFALQFPTIKSEFDLNVTFEKSFKQKHNFDLSVSDSDKSSGRAFGSVTIINSGTLEIYFEPHILSDNYLNINFDLSIEVIANIGLGLKKTIPLVNERILVFSAEGLASIYFKPTITIDVTGQIFIDYKKDLTITFDSNYGFDYSSPDPELLSLDGKIQIEIKLNFEFDIEIAGVTFITITPSVGFRIKIHEDDPIYLWTGNGSVKNFTYYSLLPKSPDEYIFHDCKNCMSFDVYFIAQLSIKPALKFFGIDIKHFSYTLTIPFVEKKLDNLSFHFNDSGFGWGLCDNYSHKISATVKSKKKGEPIKSVNFYISSKNKKEELVTFPDSSTDISTNTNGQADLYVHDSLLTDPTCRLKAVAPTGEYTYCDIGSIFDKKQTGQYNFIIKIDLKDEASLSDDENNKDDSDDENTDTQKEKKEIGPIIDTCGENVFFTIYPDENNLDADNPYQQVCYIYGSGKISQADRIPVWVKKAVVIDPETKLDTAAFGHSSLESIDISVMKITEIPSIAFNNCSTLTEVILPPTIERIGYDAFEKCLSLTQIDLPDSVKYINREAFDTTALTSFTAPPNLKEIGYLAFQSCFNLRNVDLNYGLEYIASEAFRSTPLQYLNIPPTVKNIGFSMAAHDNPEMKTVIINSDFDVVDPIISYDSNNKYHNDDINEYEEYDNGSNHSDWTFAGCDNLTKAVFNEGVTIINDGLFSTNHNLKQVSLPSTLKRIGYETFYYTDLYSVDLPEGLEYIGYSAFLGTNISDVVIPESVSHIGSKAFYKDDTLKDSYTGEVRVLTPFKSITIKNPECEIGADIIPAGKDIIVYGHDGSTAQEFAKDRNTFISLDEPAVQTTTAVTTTTTTTVTTAVSTIIGPQKECVFIALDDPNYANSSAKTILNSDVIAFFDQQTADENGEVSFIFIPDVLTEWTYIFISEINDSMINKTVAVPGKEVETTWYPAKDPAVSVYGDTNNDGEIDMSDAVLILQLLAAPNKYGLEGTSDNHISKQGWTNADIYLPGSGITTRDALTIQEYLLGKIDSLPVYSELG